MTEKKKDIIKRSIAIGVICVGLLLVLYFILRYNEHGETNMPYNISKIMLVSTAEGVTKENAAEKWNMSVMQNNDVYIYITKNDNAKESDDEANNLIRSVVIDNIQITEQPKIGNIVKYMPSSLKEGRVFLYNEEYIFNDSLTYTGANSDNSRTLEINSNGGLLEFRFTNNGIGDYVSDTDEEIRHDGSLLAKLGKKNEDIKFKVSFDLTINLKKISYKTNVSLDFPCGDIISEGTSNTELVDQNFIFKRTN